MDRVVAGRRLKVEHYCPSRDLSLSEDDRRFRPNALRCTVAGEAPRVYPFVLQCAFSPDWLTLGAAARDMGLELVCGDPVGDDEVIGRSVITGWIAVADGTIYETKRPGGSRMLITRKWPVEFDPSLLADA